MKANSWENITLICANHGEDLSHKMILQQGHSLFYACPCYKSENGSRGCKNNLSLNAFEKMLDKLDNESQSNPLETMEIKGFKWKNNGVDYEVIDQKDEHFVVSILNRKTIAN